MLVQLYRELLRIKSHYSKAPNRIYRSETNEQKLDIVHNIRKQFFDSLHQDFDQNLLIRFNDEYQLVLQYIYSQPGMSNFTIDIGLKLPVLRDSRDLSIRDFLNEIEATHTLLNNAGKATRISYVVGDKIQGQCKSRIEGVTIETLEHLKNALYTKVQASETHRSLQKKLVDTVLKDKGVGQFASRLESLAAKMTELEIQDQQALTPNVPLTDQAKAAIKHCHYKFALNQFCYGCSYNVKTLLDAGLKNTSTLADALALASTAMNGQKNSNERNKNFNDKPKQGSSRSFNNNIGNNSGNSIIKL